MIKFADQNTVSSIRQMWKICFEDDDEYIDIFFRNKYQGQNTLIYFEGEKAVASLQMQPYTINFYNQNLPFYYLVGLCTLPEYRKKGYMEKLIYTAHNEIKKRGIPLSILIPAEEWLYDFYKKYDYTQVFQKDNERIPLLSILETSPNIETAYTQFNNIYKNKDFCVQKTLQDFKAIVEEYKYDKYPIKTNLSGMACVISPLPLLRLFAKENKNLSLNIEVNKTFIYRIENGTASIDNSKKIDVSVDSQTLCQILFGFKMEELNNTLKLNLPTHHPILNLMLE